MEIKPTKYDVGDELYCMSGREVSKSTVEEIIIKKGRDYISPNFESWGHYEYYSKIHYNMSNGERYSESELFETKEELLKSL